MWLNMRDTFVGLLEEGEYPITVNGPVGEWRHPGNANICFDGYDAQDILGVLQPRLAASTGAACTTGIPEPSHVLQRPRLIGRKKRGVHPLQLWPIHY